MLYLILRLPMDKFEEKQDEELSLLDTQCTRMSETDKETIAFLVTRLLGLEDCMRGYLKIYINACQIKAQQNERYNKTGEYIFHHLMKEAGSIQQQLKAENVLN